MGEIRMMKIVGTEYQHYLFNFSSSYSGGGLKRLLAYINWFHLHGGAHFIVNKRLDGQLAKYGENTYHYIDVSNLDKFTNIQAYVDDIIVTIGGCDFYYSYNVPMKDFRAKVKWFHLSNVLPLSGTSGLNLPNRRRIELWWLGVITKKGLRHCDFVSAESRFSLNLLGNNDRIKQIVSSNGADHELEVMARRCNPFPEQIAVVVGTYFHKNVIDSYKVYQYLKKSDPSLNLVILGDPDIVPERVKQDPTVIFKGVVGHDEALEILSNAKYYINASLVENSWNAASEGSSLAQESFVSKIPPHLELFEGSEVAEFRDIETRSPMLRLTRDKFKMDNLETWDEIISNMILAAETVA